MIAVSVEKGVIHLHSANGLPQFSVGEQAHEVRIEQRCENVTVTANVSKNGLKAFIEAASTWLNENP